MHLVMPCRVCVPGRLLPLPFRTLIKVRLVCVVLVPTRVGAADRAAGDWVLFRAGTSYLRCGFRQHTRLAMAEFAPRKRPKVSLLEYDTATVLDEYKHFIRVYVNSMACQPDKGRRNSTGAGRDDCVHVRDLLVRLPIPFALTRDPHPQPSHSPRSQPTRATAHRTRSAASTGCSIRPPPHTRSRTSSSWPFSCRPATPLSLTLTRSGDASRAPLSFDRIERALPHARRDATTPSVVKTHIWRVEASCADGRLVVDAGAREEVRLLLGL